MFSVKLFRDLTLVIPSSTARNRSKHTIHNLIIFMINGLHIHHEKTAKITREKSHTHLEQETALSMICKNDVSPSVAVRPTFLLKQKHLFTDCLIINNHRRPGCLLKCVILIT